MQGLHPPVLVFVQSKDRAKELHKELAYDGVKVDAIHADRTQAQVCSFLVDWWIVFVGSLYQERWVCDDANFNLIKAFVAPLDFARL